MRHASLLMLILLLALPARAQLEDVVIETTPLTESLHMLTGRGGNLIVSSGPDGVFLIDDQYAPLSAKIRAAIAGFTDGEVRFVLNTHWHGDHTGGNENFGKGGAVIVAHDNVRERLSAEQFNQLWERTTPPAAPAALPVVSFAEGLTFHLNGQTIAVSHLAHAHTDGDAIVHFLEANIIHTGDIVFWGLYPFIDVDSGGSVDGVIAACDHLLEIGDDATRYVPGHGTPVGEEELRIYQAMLIEIRDAVAAMIADGKDLAAVQAAAPTAAYDADWGQTWLDGETFTKIVFNSLSE